MRQHKHLIPSLGWSLSLAAILPCSSYASSLQLSLAEQRQQVELSEQTASLTPLAAALSLSLNINQQLALDISHQGISERQEVMQHRVKLTQDATSLGLSYYLDDWTLSFSGSHFSSDSQTRRQDDQKIANSTTTEKLTSDSAALSASYNWYNKNWFYSYSASVQYSDWQLESMKTNNPIPQPIPTDDSQLTNSDIPPQPLPQPTPQPLTELSQGDNTLFSTSLSAAHYWSLQQDSGLLLGALLSWYYQTSGEYSRRSINDRPLPPPPNIRGGNQVNNNTPQRQNLNTLYGDDNYGQLSVYLSYDLNASWGIDLDLSTTLANEDNELAWSAGIGYYW